MRTKEEKGIEQIEEQKVIEAKIRMWQQELQDEEVRMQKKQETSSSNRTVTPAVAEYQGTTNSPLAVASCKYSTIHGDGLGHSQLPLSPPLSRSPSRSRQNREDNFDLDLEEIMVMEAIWLSIQEQGTQRNQASSSNTLHGPPSSGDFHDSHSVAPPEVSPSSSGLACAAAALAEQQHMNVDSTNMVNTNAPVFDMQQRSGSNMPAVEEGLTMDYHPQSWIEASSDCGRAAPEDGEWSGSVVLREEGEWATDYGSEVAEAGTSIAGSDVTADTGVAAVSLQEGVGAGGSHIIPESFEEQMMLAMAVSLAEARARTSAPGMTWL